MSDLDVIRGFCLEVLPTLREKAAKVGSHAVGQAYFNGMIGAFEKLNTFIAKHQKSQEELTMEKVKLEFGDEISIDELPKRQSTNSNQAAIREIVPLLKPGKARIVKSNVKWGTFSNAVYKMRRAGDIPKHIVPTKVGDKMYLMYEDNGKS